jgi:hypothetical protein
VDINSRGDINSGPGGAEGDWGGGKKALQISTRRGKVDLIFLIKQFKHSTRVPAKFSEILFQGGKKLEKHLHQASNFPEINRRQ